MRPAARGALTSGDRTVWGRRPLRPAAAVLLGLGLLAAACSGGSGRSGSSAGTNQPPPARASVSLGSQPLVDRTADQFAGDLERLEGRIVVVNFWASWCPPCRAELPDLQRASRELAGEPVTFIGVDASDERSKATEVLEQAGVTYPTVYDRKGIYGGLASQWSVTALPQTWFVDRKGRRAVKIARQLRPGEASATVKRLLATS
jgi:thiol-disulfide isomerase/thioredoxin